MIAECPVQYEPGDGLPGELLHRGPVPDRRHEVLQARVLGGRGHRRLHHRLLHHRPEPEQLGGEPRDHHRGDGPHHRDQVPQGDRLSSTGHLHQPQL